MFGKALVDLKQNRVTILVSIITTIITTLIALFVSSLLGLFGLGGNLRPQVYLIC
jgi:hypothetical protein